MKRGSKEERELKQRELVRKLLDKVAWYEKALDGVEDDAPASFPVWQFRELLAQIRKTIGPGPGRPERTEAMQHYDDGLVAMAVARKTALIAEGMSATKAEEKACEEISKTDKRRKGLSESGIRDRMQHPERYRVKRSE